MRYTIQSRINWTVKDDAKKFFSRESFPDSFLAGTKNTLRTYVRTLYKSIPFVPQLRNLELANKSWNIQEFWIQRKELRLQKRRLSIDISMRPSPFHLPLFFHDTPFPSFFLFLYTSSSLRHPLFFARALNGYPCTRYVFSCIEEGSKEKAKVERGQLLTWQI